MKPTEEILKEIELRCEGGMRRRDWNAFKNKNDMDDLSYSENEFCKWCEGYSFANKKIDAFKLVKALRVAINGLEECNLNTQPKRESSVKTRMYIVEVDSNVALYRVNDILNG